MNNTIKLAVCSALLLPLTSCKDEKLKCDNPQAIELVKEAVKDDLMETWALKLASDAFQDDIYKPNYQGSRYDWVGNIGEKYKTYLLESLDEIKNKEGMFYLGAKADYSKQDVIVENIVTEKYDAEVNKCECSSSIDLSQRDPENKSDEIKYEVMKDAEGGIVINYIYNPKAMLDKKTSAKNFINNYYRH